MCGGILLHMRAAGLSFPRVLNVTNQALKTILCEVLLFQKNNLCINIPLPALK